MAIAPAQGAPRVVVSIPPLFSLVDSIMVGVATPALLLVGGQSPHHTSLSPSAVSAVNRSDLVVWVGPALEGGLVRVVGQLETDRVLTLTSTLTGSLLPAGDQLHHDKGGDGLIFSNPLQVDPHLWLSSTVSISVVRAVTERLVTLDPANGDAYGRNAEALISRLEQWRRDAAQRLGKIKDRSFMTFHDAYRYFEDEFGLAAVEAVTLNPGRAVGAKRLLSLRSMIAEQQVACLFTEPQFEPDAARVIVENSFTRIGVLDPLGASLEPGPDMWFELMDTLVDNFLYCMVPEPQS